MPYIISIAQPKRLLILALFIGFFLSSLPTLKGLQSDYWLGQVEKFKEVIKANESDTLVLDAYAELAREYMYENPDSAIYFADKAISIAQSIDRKDLEAFALVNKSFAYQGKKDLDQVKLLLDEALAIFQSLKYKRGIAKVLTEQAQLHYQNSEIAEAIELLKKATDLELELGNKVRALRLIAGIGSLNLALSDYSRAIYELERALIIQEELKDTLNMCNTMIQIANAHLSIKDTLKAETILYDILEYDRTNDEAYYDAYQRLGDLAEAKGDYDKALALYALVERFQKTGKDDFKLAGVYLNQGVCYYGLKKIDKALARYKNALSLYDAVDYKSGITSAKINMAELYAHLDQNTKAHSLLKEAISIANDNSLSSHKSEALLLQSEIFDKQGKSQMAYDAFKEHISIRDSLLNESKIKEVTQTAMTYEFKRTQAQDSLVYVNEKAILENEIQLSDTRRNWMLGILGVLGILFFQAFRNSRSRKKSNIQLQSANEALNEKNKQNQILLEEIHHRVKNNLQVISSLLSLQSGSIENQTALDAVSESKNRVTSMAMIHQKLYQGEDISSIEMKDYFETVGSAIIDSFGSKAEDVQLHVNMPEVVLDVDTAVPIGLITTELITNSLKYAFKDTSDNKELSISMSPIDGGHLKLLVSDNGSGISASGHKQNAGFGTRLVKLLTKQIDGVLEQDTDLGTITSIKFPDKTKKVA